MADEDTEDAQSLDDRFGKIEAEQDRQGGVLQQILDKLTGSGPNPSPEGKTGDPAADIGAEVRKQLEAKEAAERAAADAKADKDRLAAAESKIAELAEKPPGPLPRRVEHFMGWR